MPGRIPAAAVETFPGLAPVGNVPLVLHFTWDYDNAGRLTSEQFDYGPGKENNSFPLYHANYLEQDYLDTFQHDLVGNRMEYKRIDPNYPTFTYFTTDYDYDANDGIISESKDADSINDDSYTEYTYNVTQQTGKNVYEKETTPINGIDEIVVNSYNLQGRLSEVDIDPDGENGMAAHVVTKYKYDDNGFRVEKDVDETVTHYLADANNHTGHTQVLEELDDTGGVQKTFLLGHDVLAQHDGTHGQIYLIYDGHGSTRMLIDPSGTIVTPTSGPASGVAQFFTYTAYGEAHGFEESEAITALLYSGEWLESTTGWQYNRERFYAPSIGRWNRRDPILENLSDPVSLHKYLYTHADPVNGIDPSGLFSTISVSVGSSIGSTLNSITAEVGQSVLTSLDQRKADLTNFSFQVAALASPLVLAIVGNFGDELFKSIGVAAEQFAERALQTARLVRSGLSIVRRPGMLVRQLTDVAGNAIPLYGTAQRIGTTGHAVASLRLAKKLAISGKYEYIALNRSWRTSTGRIASSSRRPDLIAVARDGTVDAFEIQSASDNLRTLERRLEEGLNTLPADRRGVTAVFDINDSAIR